MRLLLKKLFGLLILLSLVLTCFSAQAQVTSVAMSIPRDSIAYPGDTVRLPLILDTNIDSENIIAFRLEFQTSSELTAIGMSTENSLTSSWEVLFSKVSATEFVITGASAVPISGTGNFIYLDFLVQNTASLIYPVVQKKNSSNSYFNEGGYDITVSYGQVTVYPIPKLNVSVNPALVTKGATTQIYVSGGTEPYTYTVSDSTVGSIVNGNYLQGEGPGMVTVEVEDVNGVKGKSNSVEVRGFQISFAGPQDSQAGQEIILDVTTNDLTGLDVLSGSFDISFSSTADLVEIIQAQTLLETAELEHRLIADHSYRFAFAASSPLNAGTTLLKLKIKIKDSQNAGSVNFSARNILFNETLYGNYVDVYFSYTGLPKPSLSGGGNNLVPGETIQFNGTAGTPPYVFSVSDSTVASVSQTGLLTAIKGGSVKVKLTDSLGQFTESAVITIYDGTLRIADHTAPYGTEYDLPVYVSDLPAGRGFSAFSMTLQLTPSQVQFVDIIRTGTVSEDFTLTKNATDPANIKLAAASQNNHSAGGVLFYIRVLLNGTLTSNQYTYFYLTDILFNEGQPALRLTNGSVKIGPIPPSALDADVEIIEDTVYHFDAAAFGFSQPDNNPFTRISIEQLPASGGLYYNDVLMSSLTSVEVANFHLFTYKPAANAFGSPYGSFKFKVNDGINYSNNAYTFTFNVTPVNDAPVFTVSESLVVREQDFSEPVTITLQHQVPENEASETLSYSLEPATVDFANVTFDTSSGTVSISAKPSGYGSQVFTITADDGQSLNNLFTQEFTFTVNRLNTAPVISAQAFSVAENAALGSVVDTVLASDGEGDSLAFTITSGNTNSAFQLDASTGVLTVADAAAFDYETNPLFELTISVSDGVASSEAVVTVSVTDVDETAVPAITDQTFSINENSSANTLVGVVQASDGNNDPLAFQITAGNTNDAFVLDAANGELRVNNSSALDYESLTFFLLTVSVSDGTHSASDTITVNIVDVNEGTTNTPPSISDQSFTISEVTPAYSLVGMVVASDPDNNDLLFSISDGNTGNAFMIQEGTGEILVNDASVLDFETTPVYTLTVSVSDGFASASAVITVNLSDVDEANAPHISDQVFSVAESTGVNHVIGAVTASDPNNDPLWFAIVAGNTSNAFSLDSLSGELLVNNPVALDFETNPVFTLTVSVSDATVSSYATITVNISDVNEANAPVINDQIFSVAESAVVNSAVGTVTASDPDNGPLSFAIISGNTSGAFSLDSLSGELLVNNPAALDFETNPVFTLTVSASDESLSSYATITVNISDVNEANWPVIADQSFSVEESSAIGTVVGMVVASDPDNDQVSFKIYSGNASGAFALDSVSGELSVSNPALIDYETTPVFSLVVGASDASATSYATVTVNITDLNEANAPVINDQVFSIAELSAANALVGTVVATDPNNDPLTFAIVSGNTSDAFLVNAGSGELRINNADAVDFETNPEFELTLSVSDATVSSFATITVNVTNVAENRTPLISTPVIDASIQEDVAGVIVSDVQSHFSDPDNDVLTFEVLSSESTVTVEIVNNQVVATPSANFNGQATITLSAADGQASVADTLTLTITAVNDAPLFTLSTNLLDVEQDFTTTETVTVTPGTIPPDEIGQSVTYSLTPSSVSFANVSINSTTGEVTVTGIQGQEGEQVFTVTASDGQAVNGQATANFTLHVRMITAVENGDQRNVEVYPNPVADWLYLNTSFRDYILNVVDANGRVVMVKKVRGDSTEPLDISSLKSGFYLIRLTTGKSVYYRKIQVY